MQDELIRGAHTWVALDIDSHSMCVFFNYIQS